MPPDGKKFRDDQIFDIITGFYPDIASKIHRTKKMGKGAVGQKFITKRGFSDQTIERYRTKGLPDENQTDPWSGHGSMETKSTVKGKKGTSMEGKNLWARRKGVKDDPNKIWYKFTGGSDRYKLYGDQVWYMAGIQNPKDKKNALTDYVNSVFGDRTPQFASIYRKAEKDLMQEGVAMAQEIFDQAVQQVEIAVNKKGRSPQSPMSSEEMGYSEGDFEYLSHADVISKYPELADQITKVKGSMANPADLYKVVTINGKATLELQQDVTEMDIEQIGQHGITQVPPELVEAIAEIKKGDEGQNLSKLKQGIIKMYNTAISKDYNPVIMETKGLLINAIGGKGANWEAVLKKIGEDTKGSSTSIGTGQIGAAIGQEMLKTGMMDTSEKSSKQIAIELVAHILGVMNTETSATFRQSHRVHTYKPSGIGVYASADLAVDDELLFKDVDETTVSVLEGYSASLAQEDLTKHNIHDRGLAIHKSQKRAYAASKVTGSAASGIGATGAIAGLGVMKGLRPATVVHYPPPEKIEEALIKLIKNGIPDISSLIGKQGNDKVRKRVKGLGSNRKLTDKDNFADTQFWALPYIGVLQSEYIEEEST